MSALAAYLIALLALAGQTLGPGDHERSLMMYGMTRSYLVHIPPNYDPKQPTPVVLSLHGAWTSAAIQVFFCGLNRKADEAGFIVVYPNGTGVGSVRFWNSGMIRARPGEKQVDDVAFIAGVLDDLGTVVHVDPQRVFATGMSNGGMMCYRLAAELSDRIAAIAPVGGTMAIDACRPKRPVPVLHFHGTADRLVPLAGTTPGMPEFLTFKSVDETIRIWAKIDGCPDKPRICTLPDKAHDGTTVVKQTYGPGKGGAEVVLFLIEGGGHTWPGRDPVVKFLGKYTRQISANDRIWAFFEQHPMK